MTMQLSRKQNEYIVHATHRWNIKSGAVRSGKSYVDTAYMIPARIRERAGKPGLTVILGVSRETVERNVLQPMREIYTDKLIGTINNRNMARVCGEDVYCLGAEKISQVAKIQGSSIKYAYGDEVAKWNQEVFQMLKSRLDKPYSCFDGSCNPENPTHWLKKFLDSDADIYLQKYRIFDNPFLPSEYVYNLCKEYEGTVYYDRLIEGQWKRAEGAIYRKFADAPDSFVQKADRENIARIEIGVDFGGNGSGHSFVATGKYEGGRVQALMSRRYMNKDYPQGIDANLLSDLFLQFVGAVIEKYGMPRFVYWDNAETVLGQSITKACRKKYPRITVLPAWKIRIKDRIDYTVRLLGAGLFSLTEDCETLSQAFQDAVWDSKADEDVRLDDGTSDIDTLDAFEYSIERDITQSERKPLKGGI
jgi:PBSX family phage terminase large subunit